ncbi:MAG: hypothetical protein ABJC74_16560 [Gemmatimonadota bacterium]
MFTPKPITRAGIPLALQKAERYRVINDPSSAESICLDILQVEPDNQAALIALLLSITDQFGEAPKDSVRRAREVLPRLSDAYRQAYYAGIIAERWAKAQLRRGTPASGEIAYHSFVEAMGWYEKAESQRPAGNDEAILRWNTCARVVAGNSQLRPRTDEPVELGLE